MKTNYQAGHEAEKEAAKWLEGQGFSVLELNWKTPRCEIDIVAKKEGVIYFVEVKYRKNTNQGDGFEYITSKKLKQMEFAAETWVSRKDWSGDYSLVAIAASPRGFNLVYL